MSIYLSSMVFNNDILKAINICEKQSFNLEFSSGIPYQKKLSHYFLNAKIKKITHNYFPAPSIPFVLNLASKNELIRKKSIDHCKKNIDLAVLSNSKFYSFHSGFCVDPEPNDLGGMIKNIKKLDIDGHKNFFVKSVKELILFAKKRKIELFIENNVVSKKNYSINNNQNLFLCTTSNEIIEILQILDDPTVSLLLDTAHLKVSSNTLNNDLISEAEKLLPFVKMIHHSDNDGVNDLNDEFDNQYWFLDFKKSFNNWDHVVEVKNLSLNKIYNHLNLLL